MEKQKRTLTFLLPTFAPLFSLWACTSPSLPTVTLYSSQGNPIPIRVEIVATPEKRSFGLMYRQDLPEDHGMLFLFPGEKPLSFWMKNTPLPLDIIFINSAHTIVNITANTKPFSEESLPSRLPAQIVLEVNAGFCQRYGIEVGSHAKLPDLLPLPS